MTLADRQPLPLFPAGREAVAMARAGLQAFRKMAGHWALTAGKQRRLLGGLPKTTCYGLLRGTSGSASRDLLERLSLLLGIWASLEFLLPDPEASRQWLTRPHPAHRFGDGSPMDWMLQGTVAALTDVRRYLDGWRSGW